MIQLKDVIHYYIGQRVLVDDKEYGVLKGGTFIPNSVDQIYYEIQTDEMKENEEDEDFCMPYNDDTSEDCRLKPLLRRLEDMSEEEMIDLIQTMAPDDMEDKPTDDDYDLTMFRADGGNLVDGDVAVGADFTCICYIGQIAIKKCGTIAAYDEAGDEQELVNAPRAYHYLLRQGFDLFGLLDSGQAIDSKTLKQ